MDGWLDDRAAEADLGLLGTDVFRSGPATPTLIPFDVLPTNPSH